MAPLAGSLIPWIDSDRGDGTSLEEWKGGAETNKILGRQNQPVPIDSICVRVGAMRCHSQSLTIKMKHDVPLADIEDMLKNDNAWVRFVANNRMDSVHQLTPVAVTGTMDIAVGRVRKLAMGPQYLGAFTIGDQLYGAILMKKSWTVPFTVKLDEFIFERHPGIMTARNYESRVTRFEEGQPEKPLEIKMNEPMRHGGFTFFQESFGPSGSQPGDEMFSQFAVANNPADQWPLYSLIVNGVGLGVHFLIMLVNFTTRSRQRHAKTQASL
jgi:hypothetical protein